MSGSKINIAKLNAQLDLDLHNNFKPAILNIENAFRNDYS